MNALYDVAAHEPSTGVLLKMYRGVRADDLGDYYTLLTYDYPGAEITDRDYEPEECDSDQLDIPEYLKRDPAV